MPEIRNTWLIRVIGGLVVASLALTELAYAELDEMVVTARKREEKLQELPMSVTALDADQMNRLGVNGLADITRYTPGVNLDSGFGLNDQRLVIRGLSPSRGRPNSATLVDGIDMTTESVSTPGGSMLFNSRLLDLERVEVVKGPQSALYGRAAFAGAIQYVTRNPSDELESNVNADVGEYGRRYFDAGISGPVTDELGLRFNAMNWNEDGYYNEGFTGASLGGGKGNGLSLTGLWNPTDNLSARGRIAYSDEDFDQQATLYNPVNTFLTPPDSSLVLSNISPETFVGLFSGTPPDVGDRGVYDRIPYLTADPVTGNAYPGGELEVTNMSLTLNWDVAGGTFTSYTGFADADSQQILDGDFDVRPDAPPPNATMDIARGGSEINFATDTRMISQEIRYASDFDGPVQFTVGALYWDEEVSQTELALSVLAFPFGPTGADPGFQNFVTATATRIPNYVVRDTNSRSVYGLLEWNINDSWKASVEGRYAREELDVIGAGCDPTQEFASFRCSFSTPDIAGEFPVGSGLYTVLDRQYAFDSSSENYFAPRAMLEWIPADDLLTYISISKGVKPGGISTIASGGWMDQNADGSLAELKFDDEELIAYELGAKATLLERTLILNGAVFFQDYTDKQIPVQRISNGFAFVSLDNAGKAEVFGVELETVWQPADNVRLQFGYTYLDGEYTDLVYTTNSGNNIARAGNCTPDADLTFCGINLTGNTMEDIPEHSIVALAGFYPPFGGAGLNALFEVDTQYQSSRFTDEFNDRKLDAYTVFNVRVGVEAESWDALLYVNNALDDDTIKSWSNGTGVVATAERVDPNMFAFPADGFSIAPAPRHWGVRANMRF